MDKQILIDLKNRIEKSLSMPITRCTYKELQNAMLVAAQGDQNTFVKLMETLLTKKILLNLDADSEDIIQEIIDRYGVGIFTSKEVHDKPDFINLLTSDLIQQQKTLFFSNIIRRVDGKYLDFVCDIDSLFHIIEHFTARLEEAQKRDIDLAPYADKLEKLEERLKALKETIGN